VRIRIDFQTGAVVELENLEGQMDPVLLVLYRSVSSTNQFVSAGGSANTNTLEPPVGELSPCARRSM